MNYTCPECKTTHSSAEWDKATSEFYGTTISPIESEERESCSFNCPKCEAIVDYNALIPSDSDSITISKEEYDELLEIKAMYEGLCK